MSIRGQSQDRERALSQEKETPFAGYGDRVGSGVAYAPTQWKGGEIVKDPALVNKSLKPRRFYYSPIGDGVVAADGVELKRLPPDLTPKVELIQQRVVEKGQPGKAGVKVVERTWTTGGDTSDASLAYGGSQLGSAPSDSGQAGSQQQRATLPQPDPFAGLSDQLESPNARPLSAQSAPVTRDLGPPSTTYAPKDQWAGPKEQSGGGMAADAIGRMGAGAGDQAIGSTRSTPGLIGAPAATNGTNALGPPYDYPHSGRSSVATSASLYEPGYRYEIKKDYKVTNPRELIHQYATTTPVTAIDPSLTETTRTITRQHYTQTVEESFGPFPPYTAGTNAQSPMKFVRQLRDETMTDSQRQANRQQEPMSASSKDAQFEKRVEEIRRSTNRQTSPYDPVLDQLTSQLQGGLKHH